MNIVLISIGIFLCLCLSNFCSASEMAYSSCNVLRLENARDDGSKKAGLAVRITEHFDDALSAILIGNNLANIGASSLASVLVILITSSEDYAWVSTVVLTFLVIIFGETIPKITAKKNANRIALRHAYPVRFMMIVLKPLIWVVVKLIELITKGLPDQKDESGDEAVEELQSIIETAEDEDVLDEDQSELVQAAIDFSEISALDVMTARVDVCAIDIEDDWDDIMSVIEEATYSRIPVYEGSIDNIIGVVHEKDFYLGRLRKDTTLEDLVKPTLYTTGSTQISQLLRTLREQHHHMAVVVDEYGGTEGIITLEDILEELVGEIWDEHDEATEDFRRQSDGSWIVLGSAGVDDLYERLGLPEDEDIDSNTVNGLVQEKTCHLPKVGDRFTLGEYDGVVTRTAKRRVTEVRLTPAEKPEPKKEEDEKPHFNRLTNK